MGYAKFQTYPEDLPWPVGTYIKDNNGNKLYETEWCELKIEILERNDVAMLKRYMTTYGFGTLALADSQNADPFRVAATNGSTDALRLLLVQYVSNPVHQQKWPLEDRRFSLLSEACSHPHVKTVKLLLDSQMPVWKVN